MAIFRCKLCNGELTKLSDGFYKCLYCDTVQTIDLFDKTSGVTAAESYEEVYKSAIKAMGLGKFEEALEFFSAVAGYKDADAKAIICKNALETKSKAELYEVACDLLESADYSFELCEAADLFKKTSGYKDSDEKYALAIKRGDELDVEEKYAEACDFQSKSDVYSLEKAASIFGSITTYKDSAIRRDNCLVSIKNQEERINAEKMRRSAERRRKTLIKRIVLFSVLTAIVFSIIISKIVSAATHDASEIYVVITDITSKYDDRDYYVYMDYKISNNSGSIISYIKIITSVTDENGKELGKVTTEFGQNYNSVKLDLDSGKEIIKESYLVESRSSSYFSDLFTALYTNGLIGLKLTSKVVYVRWSDGKIFTTE